MTMREKMARAMCAANGIDPDETGYGLGNNMPKDEAYPLWWAQIKNVNAALDALMEPSEEICLCAQEGLWRDGSAEFRAAWPLAVQAIKDGA